MKEVELAHGHRARLRERFLRVGVNGLEEYELLELVLFRAMPRGDVKPLAKKLLKVFGSFVGVIRADSARLGEISGMGKSAVTECKIVHAASLRLLHADIMGRPILASWQNLLAYCRANMGHHKTEQFRILFLNSKNMLIADELFQQGTINELPIYPREVIARALEFGAAALILVHNHPSGDPTPSQDDIHATKLLIEACKHMKIAIHDHLIVGQSNVISFKSLHLL